MPTLNWIGKKAVENYHRQVPFRLLKDVPELSVGDPGTGNLIIEGDNLVALKALLPYYAGKVKCIYIDPPYNIGNEEWVYNDNVNSPEIRSWLGKVVGDQDTDLCRHDKWLCMMYPRLQLLHKFLSEDGVCFISIDENESTNLKLILDEIFGEANFVEQIVWNKRIPKNDKGIGSIHEYVFLYVKNNGFKHKFTMPKEGLEEVYDFVSKLKKRKVPIAVAEEELSRFYEKKGFDRGVTLYNNLDSAYRIWGKINVSWPNSKDGPRYEVLHPKIGKPVKIPENGWRWKKETFQKLVDFNNPIERYDGGIVCGQIWFAKTEDTQPSFIQYLDNVQDLLLRSIISVKSSGGMEVGEILPASQFPHPKTYNLIEFFLNSIKDNNCLVLDSFGGTGTTAHAVLDLNKIDGGNRKFIIVEMDRFIAQNITSERVKRIITGYKNSNGETVAGLGGGFRYCQLGDPLFDEKGNIRNTVKFHNLARHIFFTETGEPLPEGAKANSPLIGNYNGTAIYLLYNGILKDKAPDGGNVLTTAILAHLPKHAGPKVIYGTACRIGQARLNQENIIFKQLPYKLKVDAL